MRTIEYPWKNNEVIEYDVLNYSEEQECLAKCGYFTMKVEELQNNRIQFTTISGNNQNPETEEASVVVDKNNLLPIHSKVILKDSPRYGDADANAEYTSKNVKISAHSTVVGEMKKKLNFDGVVIDNTALLFIIRCLDYEDTAAHSFKVVSVRAGLISELEVKYWGKEMVVVKDMELECIRVSVSALLEPEKRQYLFYTNDSSRKLVKFSMQNQVLQINENNI